MNAVEKLEAAIEKLESIRAYPVPPEVEAALYAWAKRGVEDARAAWGIVTLTNERTIDAQLAILRDAADVASEIERFGLGRLGWGRAANGIALAEAILGYP